MPIPQDPLQRRWRCIEQLREGSKGFGLDLHPLQLEGGAFGGQLLAVPIAPLRLVRFQVRGRVHSWGEKPKGVLAVSVDLDPCLEQAPWRSHGEELPLHCLFGQDANRDVHITLPSRVSLGMVFFPLAALEVWAAQLGWPGFDGNLLPRHNVHLLDPASAAGLRCFMRRIFAIAERAPARLRRPSTQRLIREDLIPLLLEALITGPAVTRRPPARIDLVKEVQQWMHAHPTEPITLAELCRQAHASRRTLIQGFHDHLGMGPMAYLKILRLHGIRQRLLHADPSQLQIGPLADAWGFHNQGHFAAHYRHLFGERPSDTLRRAG
ncbi:MAG: helix-turn-helix domain-containing protein [Cyanobacteriota bacterium]|nr:helix-turn-helix domain-containing protein [Cyanobacteriota bacterium]